MKNKNKKNVIEILTKFINEHKPKTLTSDQDSSYLSDDVIKLFQNNNIEYYTTEKHNHNILGIINRLIRTLRDLNEDIDFTEESMNHYIDIYNNTVHSSTNIKPNDFNADDEKDYINDMRDKTNKIIINPDFTLNTNDVRIIINDKNNFNKRRSNLSKEYYKIDSPQGFGYLIKSKDHSVAYYPRHKLVKGKTNKYAETIDNDNYGIIKQIISYDEREDKYIHIYIKLNMMVVLQILYNLGIYGKTNQHIWE